MEAEGGYYFFSGSGYFPTSLFDDFILSDKKSNGAMSVGAFIAFQAYFSSMNQTIITLVNLHNGFLQRIGA